MPRVIEVTFDTTPECNDERCCHELLHVVLGNTGLHNAAFRNWPK